MLKKLIATALVVGAVAGCSGLANTLVATDKKVASLAVKLQPSLIPACAAATSLSAMAGPIAPWIIAGCGAAEAIDKLAADPSSTAWVNDMIVKVETKFQRDAPAISAAVDAVAS